MEFNVVAGLPRAGSTLLCNILNQNPRFYASSTSCMGQTVRTVSSLWTKSQEMKSELIRDPEGSSSRRAKALKGLVGAWYEGLGPVVFDKCRAWNHNAHLLAHLFPEAQMFVCVRDLRAIFGSIEKQHLKDPMLDEANNSIELTMYDRADQLFSPDGDLGPHVLGVEDLLRRRLPNVHFIQYETFVRSPQVFLDKIYSLLGENSFFQHNLDDVQNTATDIDGLYLNKFPHEGSGKVEPRPESWREHLSPDLASLIIERFPLYNQTFGYH